MSEAPDGHRHYCVGPCGHEYVCTLAVCRASSAYVCAACAAELSQPDEEPTP
jgi:hypothetical protein